MSEIIEASGSINRYIEAFKEVIDDMDSQYFQIRKARLGLFDFDIDGMPTCDIDLEKARCDEMVDWKVQEPEITAVIEADAELYWGTSGVYQQDPSLSRSHAIEKARSAQYFLREAAAANPTQAGPAGLSSEIGSTLSYTDSEDGEKDSEEDDDEWDDEDSEDGSDVDEALPDLVVP